ncbi:hypothetical protein [Alkaliphilus metalliredigens]|uniref:hypothetical protein n=1 Tax=Alkaliphilus metalliredigens TaxID=208226 RepID=UPI000305C2A4|nr:hypothetical protein [Alkaliphilus metalliredigens]
MANKIIERAAELIRTNPGLKYYEAMERARGEHDEMDRRTVQGVHEKEKRATNRTTKSKKKQVQQ